MSHAPRDHEEEESGFGHAPRDHEVGDDDFDGAHVEHELDHVPCIEV